MYNPNSPIINNMYGNGMQPYGCIPSMPIGNIGYNNNMGYNGGFYNGIYNNYYNPYLQAQIQKQQQVQYEQNMKRQSDVLIQMSKTAHAVTNSVPEQKQLEQIYRPQQVNNQPTQADMEYNMILQRQFQQPTDIYRDMAITNEINKFQQENQKFVREDMSFEEFCQNSGALLYDIAVKESLAQQRDLSKLYNKNDYSKLINGGYNNNLFRPEVTLDDMSVFPSLGQKLKDEYAIRKQQFMNAILNQK